MGRTLKQRAVGCKWHFIPKRRCKLCKKRVREFSLVLNPEGLCNECLRKRGYFP